MPELHSTAATSEEVPGPKSPANANATSATDVSIHTGGGKATPAMYFTGHHAYIVTVAKMCRENLKFTDVRIQCDDGELFAHRLVLASCSPFLRDVFLGLPQGLPEFTLIIPDIKKEVVSKLIDFLYTGKMLLARSNTYDLQQLVAILKIDPENVRIESPDENKQTRLVQSKITSMIKLKVPQLSKASPGSPSTVTAAAATSPSVLVNTVVESKAMPLRAAKRKLSQEGSSGSASPKEIKFSGSQAPSHVLSSVLSPSLRGRSHLRRGGRPRPTFSTGHVRHRSGSGDHAASGFHDLANVQTWVCAICKEYDPVLPANADSNLAVNTEWVGCDCNRWYHQYCTGLATVDDSFRCSLVKLECLPGDES